MTVALEENQNVPTHISRTMAPNEGGNFAIKDANGFALAYVYARTDPALQDRFLTPAETATVAAAIAKLPELAVLGDG